MVEATITFHGKPCFIDSDATKSNKTPAANTEVESAPVNEKYNEVALQEGWGNSTSKNSVTLSATPSGVAKIEAVQKTWGRYGKLLLWFGLILCMFSFELDSATIHNYQQYATSSFDKLSLLGTLNTAQMIVSAVAPPPIAKISDVFGRGETFIFAILCYILSYILCARASSFKMYAAGALIYSIGQAGTSVLGSVLLSDITNMKSRAFTYALSYTILLITPWISAFITQAVITGPGWRWGFGIFAILMPLCASVTVITLLWLQRKARKMKLVTTSKITVRQFCSVVDAGGVCLLCAGFAMLLLPLTVAASTPSSWRTPWIGALVTMGGVLLLLLVPYEKYIAKHPILPMRYFKNPSIVLSLSLGCIDLLGFRVTHVYMYSWSIIAHNYSPRNASFLTFSNGVAQCISGLIAGAIMYKTRRYRWILISGAIVRLIGYGIMLRLRGYDNSDVELFLIQCIQGWGSGIVTSLGGVLVAQIHVPHSELAQITSLCLLFHYIGSSVGAAIAGGIYTGSYKGALRHHLGTAVSEDVVDTIFNSITSDVPAWGTPNRVAAALAYSDVMRAMSIVALATSILLLPMTWFLPDHILGDGHNLVQSS